MTENFIKLMINTKPQIQEAHKILSRISTQTPTPRHVILRLGWGGGGEKTKRIKSQRSEK